MIRAVMAPRRWLYEICFVLIAVPALAQIPPQFAGLKNCVAVPTTPAYGTKTESRGTDCSPHPTPKAPVPPVWDGKTGAYVDPDFGTHVYRITPQAPMVPNCGYRTFNAPHQMWNADDSLMMVAQYDGGGHCATNGSGLWLFCGKNDGSNACAYAKGNGARPAHFQLIREIPRQMFSGNGADEPIIAWDPKDRCVFWYMQYRRDPSRNVLVKADVCANSTTDWSTIRHLTDTRGFSFDLDRGGGYSLMQRSYCNISDNGRLGFVVSEASGLYRFVGFGVVDTTRSKGENAVRWFRLTRPPGDTVVAPSPWNKQPSAACVDQSGKYVTTPWNVSHSWHVVSATRDRAGTVTVQVAGAVEEVFVGASTTVPVAAPGDATVEVTSTSQLLPSGTPQVVTVGEGQDAEDVLLMPRTVTGTAFTATFRKAHPAGVPVRLKVWLLGTGCNGSRACSGDSGFDGPYSVLSVRGSTVRLQTRWERGALPACEDAQACRVGQGALADHSHAGNYQWDAADGAFIGRSAVSAGLFLSLEHAVHQDTIYMAGGKTALATRLCSADSDQLYDYARFDAYSLAPGDVVGCKGEPGTSSLQMLDSVRTGGSGLGWSGTGTWHVSGRGSDLKSGVPGWELVSTYRVASSPDTSPQTLFQSEIFAIRLDNSNEVRRIAHDFGCTNASGNNGHMYFAEPHATWNHHGNMIAFTSSWGNCDYPEPRALGDALNLFIVDLSPSSSGATK